MDTALLGLVAGSGWASGINLYGVVALLSILGRTGVADVPESLTRTDILVVALGMFALEFVADKIPWFDSVWDTVHTVIRPLGAAALGAVLSGDAGSVSQALAATGSGGLAFAAHAAKATSRLAINSSPEPASNIGASLVEDGLVAVVVWFAVTNPLLALALVLVLLVAGTAVVVALFGAARRGLAARRERRRRRRTGAPG
ncbi:MAG: DUF4126 domain-containing protein [Nitriliruptoraceae bacterium]|nr:DUF4126 domain-containing protein [Nitriliruptoraceae bacterium]